MNKQSWHQHSKVAPKAERTGHDGFVYDSKTEYQRYCYLNLLAKAGEIKDLRRQVKYPLQTKTTPPIIIKTANGVGQYTPDFVYVDAAGNEIIEDVKGYRDEASKFRIRVFEALYSKKVTIVKKKGKAWITE